MNKNTVGLLVAFLMAGLAINAFAIATVESMDNNNLAMMVADVEFPQLKFFNLSESL